jgi:hypothetical protein
MTDANPTETSDAPDLIGTQIHFLHTGKGYPVKVGNHFETRFSQRGQTLTVIPALLESSLNSKGESWLTQSEARQRERYGFVWFAPGPAPESLSLWSPDSTGEKELFYNRERAAAYAIVDEEERAASLASIKKRFGPMLTSQTLRSF